MGTSAANDSTSTAPVLSEPSMHNDTPDTYDESASSAPDVDNIRDDVARDAENICDDVQPSNNIRDDDANICDNNANDAADNSSTCENTDDADTTADSNICDDALDTCDEHHNEQEDMPETPDSVAQVDAKDDIYAALRFECGNDMSVTIGDESDTVTISHGVAGGELDDAQDAERPAGRHYIDADAILPDDEPARYQSFMIYGRGDADEIADRCPASELDFDAILADYDRADHRMVRDALDGLYGTMAESGEMSEGDPRPFPVYGGAAMPLNNWSWQDVNSVRKHIARMPLPVVTGSANVTADIKVDDGVDEPQADADAVDSRSEAMHDVPFADSDSGGCGVAGGRHFKCDVADAVTDDGDSAEPTADASVDTDKKSGNDADNNASRVSSLVDCGNGYFLYVDGGDDAVCTYDAVDGKCEKGETGKSRGKSGRRGTGGSVAAGASSSMSRGMSDAVKIGCIAAMVIARKAARRVR